MLSQDIAGLLLELLQLVSILSYRFVLWAFRCGLTADLRLHIARVCGRGSLVKVRGLTWIRLLWSAHLCWLDATRAAGMETGNGIVVLAWSPKKFSCRRRLVIVVGLTGRMLSGQSTDQTMHVLVCWKAWRHLVADWPYIRAFQMTILEIIIAGLHCLCVQSVLVSNTRILRCALVHDIVRSLGDTISQGRWIHDRYRDIA